MNILRKIVEFLSLNEHRVLEKLPWIELNSLEQLDRIKQDSKVKPAAIYKHSINCATSSVVLHGLKKHYDIEVSKLDFYYIDITTYPLVCREIDFNFNLKNKSPQIILIKNGKLVYQRNNGGITARGLKKQL